MTTINGCLNESSTFDISSFIISMNKADKYQFANLHWEETTQMPVEHNLLYKSGCVK